MSHHHNHRVHHCDELDPTLLSSLRAMVSSSPCESHVEDTIQQLRGRLSPNAGTRPEQPGSAMRRLSFTVAASLALGILGLLWSGAQTRTWMRIATAIEYDRAAQGPAEVDILIKPSTRESKSTGKAILRFVLMLHIGSLVVGLYALFSAWSLTMIQWSISVIRRRRDGPSGQLWRRKILLSGIVLYASGMALGCAWAQVTLGAAWRWDPREAFPLLTLGIASLWYLGRPLKQNLQDGPPTSREALLASLAFWFIALAYWLTILYTDQVHAYGNPSMRGASIVMTLLAVNLLVVLAAHGLTRWRSKSGLRSGTNQRAWSVSDHPPGRGHEEGP